MREELIKMFTDESYDFNNVENAEKLIESFNNMYGKNSSWKIAKAKEDHDCIRKCKITKGSVFSKHTIDKDKVVLLCPKCLSMVLFFNESYKQPMFSQDW